MSSTPGAVSFAHQLQIPAHVESLEEYLLAFFRASAQGPWWLDDEAPIGSPPVLRFYRGNWLVSERTGQRTPLPPLLSGDRAAMQRSRPAQLAVAVRTGSQGKTAIAIQYRYLYPAQEPSGHQQREREQAHWKTIVRDEVEQLRRYLQQSLGVAEVLRAESSSGERGA